MLTLSRKKLATEKDTTNYGHEIKEVIKKYNERFYITLITLQKSMEPDRDTSTAGGTASPK